MKNASSSKELPDPLLNPFNQKQELFNKVVQFLKHQNVTFYKSDCSPRVKNRKTGAATELVFEITEIIWKVGLAEKQFKSSFLWSKVPGIIRNLGTFELKSKDPIVMSQLSSKSFASHIREVASKALMASQNLVQLKLALLSCAEIFIKYSEYLKSHLENVKTKKAKDGLITSATEAVLHQIGNREKVSLIEAGTKPLKNQKVIEIVGKLEQSGFYQPVNISTILPTNRCSRSTIIHRDLPNQAPQKIVLWTFDNCSCAPQSIFALLVDPADSHQAILDKTAHLKPKLQSFAEILLSSRVLCPVL